MRGEREGEGRGERGEVEVEERIEQVKGERDEIGIKRGG